MKRFRHLIFTAALGLSALHAQAASVLVVLSDADHLDLKDGKVFPTGFYLNELMQPVKRLLDAGHQVTFATPGGLAPTLDKSSDDKKYFNNDDAAWRTHRALLDALKLTSPEASPVISLARAAQRGYGEFDALYIPGGHAPMQDLLTSRGGGRGACRVPCCRQADGAGLPRPHRAALDAAGRPGVYPRACRKWSCDRAARLDLRGLPHDGHQQCRRGDSQRAAAHRRRDEVLSANRAGAGGR